MLVYVLCRVEIYTTNHRFLICIGLNAFILCIFGCMATVFGMFMKSVKSFLCMWMCVVCSRFAKIYIQKKKKKCFLTKKATITIVLFCICRCGCDVSLIFPMCVSLFLFFFFFAFLRLIVVWYMMAICVLVSFGFQIELATIRLPKNKMNTHKNLSENDSIKINTI